MIAWRGYGGHGIGLEVHDPAHFYDGGAFQVGEVFTVDYALTESGLEWLPKGAPREVGEIENMMQQKGALPGGESCGEP